jgi:hypothetical protein
MAWMDHPQETLVLELRQLLQCTCVAPVGNTWELDPAQIITQWVRDGAVLEFELRAPHLLDQHLPLEPRPSPWSPVFLTGSKDRWTLLSTDRPCGETARSQDLLLATIVMSCEGPVLSAGPSLCDHGLCADLLEHDRWWYHIFMLVSNNQVSCALQIPVFQRRGLNNWTWTFLVFKSCFASPPVSFEA